MAVDESHRESSEARCQFRLRSLLLLVTIAAAFCAVCHYFGVIALLSVALGALGLFSVINASVRFLRWTGPTGRWSLWNGLGLSVLWAFAGAWIGLAIGLCLGCLAYPLHPTFFNNTIYGPEWSFGTEYSPKVHIQTCIHLALNGALPLLLVGLTAPWICLAKNRFCRTPS